MEPLEKEQWVQLWFYDADLVNNVKKRRVIKAFLRMQKANLIFLQETKLKGTSRELIRSGQICGLGSHKCSESGWRHSYFLGLLITPLARC